MLVSLRTNDFDAANCHRGRPGIFRLHLLMRRDLGCLFRTGDIPSREERVQQSGISNNNVSRISLHDFNKLEGRSLWRFLNIKGEGAISQNPVCGPRWPSVRDAACTAEYRNERRSNPWAGQSGRISAPLCQDCRRKISFRFWRMTCISACAALYLPRKAQVDTQRSSRAGP
jgi:hypothetical protein